MYASFFGLKHEPFSIAPDPRYLFMSERHREALAHLLYGVNSGGGFVLLSGEIGAGKTTVCRCFLEQIPRRTNVAYIFNPKLTVTELLQSVCEEFGIPAPQVASGEPTVKEYLDPLNEFLLKTHAVNQNNVLVIDEAQMLSADVLEQLRLLTNLETSERKLLQIILIGQPELRDMLARPELEQLAQRVIARYHLGALTPEETERYIRHRLTVAGMKGAMPFDARAIERIHQLSRGVPRRVNLLCDRALLGAYSASRGQVDRAIVDRAASEVFDNERHGTTRTRRSSLSRGSLSGSSGSTSGATSSTVSGTTSGTSRRRLPPTDRHKLWSSLALGGALLAAGALVAYSLPRRGAESVAMAAASGARPSASTPSGGAGGGAGGGATGGATGGAGASGQVTKGGAAAASGFASNAALASASTGASTAMSPPGATSISASASSPPRPSLSTATELQARLKALTHEDREAWRALALAWKLGLAADDADPCATLLHNGLPCFHAGSTTLALIRQLDRPGLLTLHDTDDKPVFALLTGLGESTATLHLGGAVHHVSLVTLAQLWRGEFGTLWRAPPGYTGKRLDWNSGEAAAWLGPRLGKLQGQPPPTSEATWKAQVSSFQVAQGLKADGVAGPTTFMQVNRASGIDEPRLSTAEPAVSASRSSSTSSSGQTSAAASLPGQQPVQQPLQPPAQ